MKITRSKIAPETKPETLSYDQMLATDGIYKFASDSGTRRIIVSGNPMNSPCALYVTDGSVQGLSTTAWTKDRFVRLHEVLSLTFDTRKNTNA